MGLSRPPRRKQERSKRDHEHKPNMGSAGGQRARRDLETELMAPAGRPLRHCLSFFSIVFAVQAQISATKHRSLYHAALHHREPVPTPGSPTRLTRQARILCYL